MKTLVIIPSKVKAGLEAAVAADAHPIMDYDALCQALRQEHDSQADVLDYGAVERAKQPWVRALRKLAGRDAALVMMSFQQARKYDVVFTNAENIALPLSLLFKLLKDRPRHVTIGHRLSAKKKQFLYRWLKVHNQMDVIFVYATSQLDVARKQLGIPDRLLRLIPFHADHRFYRPMQEVTARDHQICAAGLEWRDYPTLIEAVADKTDLSVRLAAASPWSKHSNETEKRSLPAHVQARRYEYGELRKLYAESEFVVVPLYQNDFQAGVTTILEAMAMGKAVIATGTLGQTDVIEEGVNGLYVAPGDVRGWKQTIDRLRSDTRLRAALGRRARRWLEENATLDHWVENVVAAIQDRPVRKTLGRRPRAASPEQSGVFQRQEVRSAYRAGTEQAVDLQRGSAADYEAAKSQPPLARAVAE